MRGRTLGYESQEPDSSELKRKVESQAHRTRKSRVLTSGAAGSGPSPSVFLGSTSLGVGAVAP